MARSFWATDRIKTAVVTGQHPFDVPGFQALFQSIPEIEPYIQHLDDFVADAGKVRRRYDVVVFYNFHQADPSGEQGWWEKGTKEALEELGETEQGIFILHHAILAFPRWEFWSQVCGIEDRSFGFHIGQDIFVEVADPRHPITQGLKAWSMVDETYTMNEPGEGREILLTTDHPNSMNALAWAGQFGKARVLCCQSGHDNQPYANEKFRTVVGRGIQWLAGKL